MSNKPIVQQSQPATGHVYTSGTRVRNVALWSLRYKQTGTIVGPVPWTFARAGYDVRYDSDGEVLPVSEMYLEVAKGGDGEGTES